MKKLLLSVLLALGLASGALALPLTPADIAKLTQECPNLDEYKGSPAVIWNRKQLYTQDPQGRMVKTLSYVILCGPTARLGWLEDQLFAPAGGRIELEQAAIFDPGSSRLVRNLDYDRDELNKHGRLAISFPKIDSVYILALSCRMYYPEPNVLEDIAWLSSEYPTWEGSVQIRIAKTQELIFESSSNTPPSTQADDNFRRYGWFYFKQPANRGVVGLVESSDPYVVFSLSAGPLPIVEMMNDLSSRKWPSLPEICVSREGSERDQAVRSIENFWRSKYRLPSRGTWRSAKQVPADGPWTTWEAAYLASGWLQQRGWKSEVWFEHVLPQSRDSISCAAGLTRPVLLVCEPGGKKSWYYVPGQPSEPGQVPASLRGKAVYAAGTKKLRKKSIGGTHMEKNRLTIAWDLDVDADCVVTGKVDIRIRHKWTDIYDSLDDGRKELLYAQLAGLEGWIEPTAKMEVSPLGSQGFKVVLPVKARSGIEGQQGLMIGLPSITPGSVERLKDVSNSAVLKFPFVVEQSYTVKIPKGYRVMSVPLKQEQTSMAGNYTSQFRVNQRKNEVEGHEKQIVSQSRIDAPYLPGFKRQLESWGAWQRNNLALLPTGRSGAAK